MIFLLTLFLPKLFKVSIKIIFLLNLKMTLTIILLSKNKDSVEFLIVKVI